MKNKLIYVFFAVAALICCFVCTAFASFDISYEDYLNLDKANSAYECFSKGDANGDGNVSAVDARTVLRISVDLEDIATVDISKCDINGDGKLTAADARGILRLSVKLDSFPEHAVVEIELIPATCSTKGLVAKICLNCMKVCTEVQTPQQKHVVNLKWQIVEEATCQKEGKAVRVCKFEDCGAIIDEQSIAKTGHSGEWTYFPNEKYPTGKSCYDPVNKERYCEVCGAYEAKTENPPGAHSYVKVTVEPSCFKDGEEYERCTHCGTTKNEKILTQYGKHNVKTEIIPSTCTVQGEEKDFCIRCDEVFDSVKLPLAEHEFDNRFKKQKVAETCTEDGVSTVTCSVCGLQEDIAWPEATGHDAPDGWELLSEPSCTEEGSEKGFCLTCNKEVTQPIAALGHTVSVWTNVKPATCKEEGLDIGYCDVCGAPDATNTIPKTEHNFDTSVTYIKEGYIACETASKAYHRCTTEGCNARMVFDFAKQPHTNKNLHRAKELSPATCTEAQKIIAICDYCDNTFGNIKDGKRKLGHNYGEWQTIAEATCTAEGVKQKYCQNSGCQEIKQEFTKKIPHDTEHIVEKVPTCAEPGFEYDICKKCNEKFNVSAPPPTDEHVEGEREIFENSLTFDKQNNLAYSVCITKCQICQKELKKETVKKIEIIFNSPDRTVSFVNELTSLEAGDRISFTIDGNPLAIVSVDFGLYGNSALTATDGVYSFTIPEGFSDFDSINISINIYEIEED